ncbi:MAG: PSD1 and planctomycete cytochrome C domain-containing protein [bacterium]|nr:PSD1 and planctomycete cytochrome C domain-containing protein [bacterium]
MLFTTEILPILREHCFECHSHEYGEANGQLMLDSLAGMRTGGTRGSAVLPRRPKQSLLVRALEYNDGELQMPPGGKLSDAEIESFRRWIAAGAHVPEKWQGESQAVHAVDQESRKAQLARSHWAYQAPRAWVRRENTHASSAIDQILLSKLDEHRLGYSPRAERATLIRRLSYDLRGLPPSFEELRNFVSDPRPDKLAVTALVDQWLASPRFGERWARYWMDVARYADNKGYVFEEDREYPEAYRYRDWLVAAFNSDMPYDQFIELQIAADLHQPLQADNLPALGFVTLGRRFLNNKLDIIDDRLDVVTRGTMGMTLACARCHDHKYDPIGQDDYYALFGVFLNTEEPGGEPWPHRLSEREQLVPSHVLIRGSPANRGKEVPRRFVNFLAPEANNFPRNNSGRLELAERITDCQNPLTARVIANRVWMHLIGTSLVETPSDFGTRCGEPEQLELLDHLAIKLMDQGWSLKELIRNIVLSDCYAQQSLEHEQGQRIDPANRLYWRMNRRRLDFEALRDTLLVVTGQLDGQMGGKSQPILAANEAPRRTVYSYIDRQNLPSIFRTFDMASPDTHSPRRAETTVPQQGLFLLNSDFVAEISLQLAHRLRPDMDIPSARRAAIEQLFTQVLSREPSQEELDLFATFVKDHQATAATTVPETWICGYAAYDENNQTIGSFQRLPVRTERAWQGGKQLPDDEIGWCFLSAEGGHPGDAQHAAVRRWIAPAQGRIQIRGKLTHSAAEGDGVRGSVMVAGRAIGSWRAATATTETQMDQIEVQAGDCVDFVTDCVSNPSHDSFEWPVTITLFPLSKSAADTGDQSVAADSRRQQAKFRSVPEFPSQPRKTLDAWAQAVQILLASNELIFID